MEQLRSVIGGAEEKIKEQEGLLRLREKELDALSQEHKEAIEIIREGEVRLEQVRRELKQAEGMVEQTEAARVEEKELYLREISLKD